jgi:hypothetical protein
LIPLSLILNPANELFFWFRGRFFALGLPTKHEIAPGGGMRQ